MLKPAALRVKMLNGADHWLLAPCHDTAGDDARVEFRVAGFDWNARWDFAPLQDTIEHSRSLIAWFKSLDDGERLCVLTNECGWARIGFEHSQQITSTFYCGTCGSGRFGGGPGHGGYWG